MLDDRAGRFPGRDECVLRDVLERHAREHPEKTWVRFDDDVQWSYAEMLHRTRRAAAGLQSIGVRQGDHVLIWLPNGKDALLTWFAVNYVGAVAVPINTAYKGNLLAHALAMSDATVAVVHTSLLPRLHDVDTATLARVVLVGEVPEAGAASGLEFLPAGPILESTAELHDLERPIEPWDTRLILFTSGTTGPSKAVLSSYVHAHQMFGPTTLTMIDSSDRWMINSPLFHVGGTGLTMSMLLSGGSIALVDGFSASQFWAQVRRTGSTIVFLLGVMANFIKSQPASPSDREHPVRTVFITPMVDDPVGFHERFGADVYGIYNMSEISTPLITPANPVDSSSCGRLRPGAEVRLVDENDIEVPIGEMGEFSVRTDIPWAITSGYHKMPEKTARAWRNGWFHTGDAGRRNAAGDYYFVDRLDDTIRRRGENISSLEVETDIVGHPAVLEAAVVPVPSEHSEDEVLAVVALSDPAGFDEAEFIRHLADRMPYFMVPRYVRVVEALPKTPTQKVLKHILRAEGLTSDTWDREAHGIRVERERL